MGRYRLCACDPTRAHVGADRLPAGSSPRQRWRLINPTDFHIRPSRDLAWRLPTARCPPRSPTVSSLRPLRPYSDGFLRTPLGWSPVVPSLLFLVTSYLSSHVRINPVHQFADVHYSQCSYKEKGRRCGNTKVIYTCVWRDTPPNPPPAAAAHAHTG